VCKKIIEAPEGWVLGSHPAHRDEIT